MKSIEAAAGTLSDQIFCQNRSYSRRGVVRPADGMLHVYTWVPPAKWPRGRSRIWQGFPVMWHHVLPVARKYEQEQHPLTSMRRAAQTATDE